MQNIPALGIHSNQIHSQGQLVRSKVPSKMLIFLDKKKQKGPK